MIDETKILDKIIEVLKTENRTGQKFGLITYDIDGTDSNQLNNLSFPAVILSFGDYLDENETMGSVRTNRVERIIVCTIWEQGEDGIPKKITDVARRIRDIININPTLDNMVIEAKMQNAADTEVVVEDNLGSADYQIYVDYTYQIGGQ